MKNILEYFLFLLLALIVRILGLGLSRRMSVTIAMLFFYIIPIRKNVTLQNLRKAFPEYSENKIREIAFGSYKSFCITLVEILYIPFMNEEQIKKAVNFENVDLVKKFYDEGKGLILLSGHFGNWEYVALSASLQIDTPFHVVVKSQRNPFVNNYLNKGRTKWINQIVPLGASIRKVYSVLKEKKIVAMVADQRGPSDGMRVNFFGRNSAIYSGPAQLAVKTNAPILYGLTIRNPDFSYNTKIHEINLNDLPIENEDKVKEISQRHMAFLETAIREHPEQWLWMHNIWKY